MKVLTAILFVLGCFWALLAWTLVVLPVGIVMPEYHYQKHDTLFSLAASALALAGYWVWVGWGFRLRTGRFPLVSPKRFWLISLIVHLLWAVVVPYGFWIVVHTWSMGDSLILPGWILLNLVVAIVGCFAEVDSSITEAQSSITQR